MRRAIVFTALAVVLGATLTGCRGNANRSSAPEPGAVVSTTSAPVVPKTPAATDPAAAVAQADKDLAELDKLLAELDGQLNGADASPNDAD